VPTAALKKHAVGSSLVNESDLRGLRAAWHAGHLVPFIGAGFSMPYGVPSWKQLVIDLVVEQARHRRALEAQGPHVQRALADWLSEYFGYDPVILARVVKHALRRADRRRGKGSERTFLDAVRRRLYPKGPTAPREGTGLAALADLIASGKRGQVPAVVCFNFDDLLEAELSVRGVEHYSVWHEGRTSGRGIPIIHPHGFLPRAGPLDGHAIVFTEDEYHQLNELTFHWAMTEIVSQLRKNTALFLGLSMSDANLRRLLDVSYNAEYPAHWLVQRRHAIDPEMLERTSSDLADRARLLSQRSTAPALVEASMLRALLPGVLRLADTYDRELFGGMGVKTLWVEAFDDVPRLIREIGVRAPRRPRAARSPSGDADDPHKNQWGGHSERGYRRLEAELVPERDGWLRMHLSVRSTRPRRNPLRGKVVFHLHDIFPEPVRVVTARQGVATLDVWGYMPFTVGAEVDGGRTRLELDLATAVR
jgi:hypothetical protein